MTKLENYISKWNTRYNDSILWEQVKCIRGFSGHNRCNIGGDDLIIPEDVLSGTIKCPLHDEYWIATPRRPRADR